ncbi:MAG TPA: hypothetical protein VF824_01205 [Thermoanaerobaculia bacterium]|jgi:hypothetical protein
MTAAALDPIDFDTTLLRRGTRAATFTDMAELAEMLEHRPRDKLLAELPGIASLSATKFTLARAVLRRRMRGLAAVEREQLRVLAVEAAATAPSHIGARIADLFV